MLRVNTKCFRQALRLWPLIVLPSVALAGPGHDAKKAPAAAHWMAPEDAAQRKNPVAAGAASSARGEKLFQANCASCHGAGGKGNGPAGAALDPKPADLTAMAGQHPDGDFAWKIANGRGSMPAWKRALQDEQIWDLVNYIQGLAKPKKNPPGADDHRH